LYRQNLTNMMGLAAGWPQLEQLLLNAGQSTAPPQSTINSPSAFIAEFWRKSSAAIFLQQRTMEQQIWHQDQQQNLPSTNVNGSGGNGELWVKRRGNECFLKWDLSNFDLVILSVFILANQQMECKHCLVKIDPRENRQ
jgi:hypothetical protein